MMHLKNFIDMGHLVTLGGERVGSGNKNKIYLHNYERSTHNLSKDWLSTMGCGMLIPFMCELVTRDDKYEIDLSAGLRTIPTKGPLFGSFKLQLDVYQCPLRLYQALLHNNPLAIGLKANQVKFPKIRLYDEISEDEEYKESKAATNSLVKYLGISGIGTINNENREDVYPHRDLFGSAVLAYYDIFKNYYANKQEENAYTLSSEFIPTGVKYEIQNIAIGTQWYVNTQRHFLLWNKQGTPREDLIRFGNTNISPEDYDENSFVSLGLVFEETKEISSEDIGRTYLALSYTDGDDETMVEGTINSFMRDGIVGFYKSDDNKSLILDIKGLKDNKGLCAITINDAIYERNEEVVLNDFPLSNIDDMRYKILSFHQLGQSYIVDGDNADSPYYYAIGDSGDFSWKKPLAGICVKTYQSDLFNNWLNSEIIDGENGIAEITAISTQAGKITIDQLQFSEKLYNLLNRIAVSGGTYQDYLDAAYTQSAKRFEESPIWVGGLSDEVIFEEIVQTAPAGDTQLGTLGGRGNLLGKEKGGKITVKIDEPSLIIGIVSITPRIVYTQGNKWFNTEIDSLQDIHVPALDAIGFQNLMAEQLHFGTTIIKADTSEIEERPTIGKVPAWINYMTNIDEAYGDFAATDGDGFMVLNRNYEVVNGELQDATTYVDPAKFNYAFAYSKRDAQNFWVKIKCDIKARRLMSAKQIPTA